MRPFLLITFEILHKSGSRELPVEEFSALVLRSDENHIGFRHFCALFILANIIMSKNLDQPSTLVELAGFEPATPGMQNRCSTI